MLNDGKIRFAPEALLTDGIDLRGAKMRPEGTCDSALRRERHNVPGGKQPT